MKLKGLFFVNFGAQIFASFSIYCQVYRGFLACVDSSGAEPAPRLSTKALNRGKLNKSSPLPRKNLSKFRKLVSTYLLI